MRIGAHVSSAGSLDRAIDRAQEIGAETIQIFISPPQGWRVKEHPEKEVQAFREKAVAAHITPVFLHGIYLVNLATPHQENLEKGIASIVFYMQACARIGASGVVFHVGSHGGRGLDADFGQVVESLRRILAASPPDVLLVLENNAGQGGNIGVQFADLARYIQAVGDPRLKVCLDTAHTLASGYDVTTPKGVAATMEEFDRELGLSALVAVHANDSKTPLGSNVDRHENIGEGHIGQEGFKAILAHRRSILQCNFISIFPLCRPIHITKKIKIAQI